MAERYGPDGRGLAPLPKADIPGKGKVPGRKASTYVSGLCRSGYHEGRPHKDSEGLVAAECKFALHCTCTCHDDEAMLRKMGGIPDPEFPIPGAPPPARVLDGNGTSIAVGTLEAKRLEDIPDEPPKNGGGLEWKVYEFLKPYVELGLAAEGVCTVGFICQGLNGEHSSGAVNAVLMRWEERGFAVVERKPTRFISYTEAGTQLGLAKFKALKK